MTRIALVLGARGQIGRFLLPRLRESWIVHATTRGTLPADTPWLHWHRVDLFGAADLALEVDTVFGLGPLDGLVQWLPRSPLRPRRVVAFSSTSAATKRDSPDPRERELAQRLVQSEHALQQWAAHADADLTVLRPTLIYGAGIDRNLTRLARVAGRWGFLPLPRDANGLRQPVHADDLAEAALQAAVRSALPRLAYELPGGETLGYREMAARVLACLDPPRRVLPVPTALLRLAARLARAGGGVSHLGEAMLDRLRHDLVFDATPARRDFGYAPRGFAPARGMFAAAESD